MPVGWCVTVQQEHEDTQVKLQSQSQEPELERSGAHPGSGSERSECPAGCVLQWKISAAVLCCDVIRDPVILPCDMFSLCAHKGGQRRVWRMSCLLWILTGAGNVGHTQCECSQIKADKRKGGCLYSYPKCLSSSVMLYSGRQHHGSYQD